MDKSTFYLKLDEMLELDPGSTQGSTRLADMEAWDSLAVMSFIAMADSDYGISLAAKAIAACRTVDDLVALIEEKQHG